MVCQRLTAQRTRIRMFIVQSFSQFHDFIVHTHFHGLQQRLSFFVILIRKCIIRVRLLQLLFLLIYL